MSLDFTPFQMSFLTTFAPVFVIGVAVGIFSGILCWLVRRVQRLEHRLTYLQDRVEEVGADRECGKGSHCDIYGQLKHLDELVGELVLHVFPPIQEKPKRSRKSHAAL